ncbi:MAG TPA: glycerophosphodiester phosphodiesterase family protein [Verrucomicrobiae bacterium]|jgi:glycerophosphoryl diester phosphodiesterase|nr:glycerophosphodiester phosphodiesterase family protein [Verrucomicrobiae bacterium]
MNSFIRVAHRGSSGTCPENTRAAVEKAIASGVEMVEADCQLSKDGHVVVFHDERLARTAHTKGFLRSKTLKELKKLDVGGWFKKSFKGERILTLEELLELIDGRAELNVDIKGDAQGSLGIELKLLFTLSHYDYLERTVFSSFDHRVLRRLRELAPDTRIAVLHGAGIKENPFQLARELGAEAVHIQKELATPPVIERAAQAGVKTLVWTVNEVADMEKYLKLGVDGIFSDYPEKFWKLRQKRR